MSFLSPLYEENEVLRQVAHGDEKAFRFLFNKYHQKLGAHILRLTRSHEMAEEIVQDVFLKIWINRESLTGVQNFQAYLYVMSKNHALNCLKKVASEKMVATDFDEVGFDIENEDSGEDNDRYILIDEAIDHLPPQQRQVYLLSRHERLRYTEIAARLNLSKETVKKYLQISSESIRSYIHKKLVISLLIFLLYFI